MNDALVMFKMSFIVKFPLTLTVCSHVQISSASFCRFLLDKKLAPEPQCEVGHRSLFNSCQKPASPNLDLIIMWHFVDKTCLLKLYTLLNETYTVQQQAQQKKYIWYSYQNTGYPALVYCTALLGEMQSIQTLILQEPFILQLLILISQYQLHVCLQPQDCVIVVWT